MKLYADRPARRWRQIIGDLLVLTWVVGWVVIGRAVHGVVSGLAAPGRALESAGTSLGDGLTAAGDQMARVPLVGAEIRAPFDAAGGAAASIADAGTELQAGVAQAALVAALAVAAWPIVLAVLAWLVARVRFARRAAAAQRLIGGGAGLELFALRALAHQPLPTLSGISADPAGDWRRLDPDVIGALADLELRAVGIARRPAP